MEYEGRWCMRCEWSGDESELVNPGCFGDDYFVEGEQCPKCGGDVGDEIPEGQQEAIESQIRTMNICNYVKRGSCNV